MLQVLSPSEKGKGEKEILPYSSSKVLLGRHSSNSHHKHNQGTFPFYYKTPLLELFRLVM